MIESAIEHDDKCYSNGDAHIPQEGADNIGAPVLHVVNNRAMADSSSSLDVSEDGEAWQTVHVIRSQEHADYDVREDVDDAVWERAARDGSDSTTGSDVAVHEDVPDDIYEPDQRYGLAHSQGII